jgi:predicted nucleic acid-binding protein
MKVFADANILVSVITKEYPLFPYTSRILSLAGTQGLQVFTSPICLAIAFYFAEKKFRSAAAKEKLQLLSRHIRIAGTDQKAVDSAFADPSVKDLEDGLEYYSALEAGCDSILTEDKKGFYYSKIQVLTALEFYDTYMGPKRS